MRTRFVTHSRQSRCFLTTRASHQQSKSPGSTSTNGALGTSRSSSWAEVRGLTAFMSRVLTLMWETTGRVAAAEPVPRTFRTRAQKRHKPW